MAQGSGAQVAGGESRAVISRSAMGELLNLLEVSLHKRRFRAQQISIT